MVLDVCNDKLYVIRLANKKYFILRVLEISNTL
jgi:hypothetical protein